VIRIVLRGGSYNIAARPTGMYPDRIWDQSECRDWLSGFRLIVRRAP
jgi:hypothetical protein